jgi:putative tryptophan/tyrosine transport system substrate-binding protein
MLCEPRGLTIRRATVRGPNDLAQAFATLEQQGAHAVIVPNTSLLNPLGAQIASLAEKHRLPSFGSPIFARAGGLMAHGPILRGAQPASLPMEGPTKFEMIVNLNTARTPGLTISTELLERADQIIE